MTSYAEVFAGVYTAVAAHAQHQDAGNTDGIMALYTPDAVLEVPGMGVFEGADAIRAAWDDWKPKGLQRHMPVNIVITDWDEEEARATTDVVFLAQGDGRLVGPDRRPLPRRVPPGRRQVADQPPGGRVHRLAAAGLSRQWPDSGPPASGRAGRGRARAPAGPVTA